MRNSKTLDLGGEVGKLTVFELKVGLVRRLVADYKSAAAADLLELFTSKFSELEEVLGDVIVFENEGVGVDDLAISELEQIKDALLEVNQSFLKIAEMMGLGVALDRPLPASPPPQSKRKRK